MSTRDCIGIISPITPIFADGLFRSGTSLLRAMIGQHSNIAAGLETHWYEANWDARTARNGESIDVWLQRLSDFFEIDIVDVDNLATASVNIIEFLSAFMGTYAAHQNKPRWLEKTCGNIFHIDRIFEGWPEARFVQIIRDPRDVLASLRRTNKYSSLDSFVQLWCKFARASESFKNSSEFDRKAFLEIHYEDLVRNPERVMKTVVKFVGEPWEDEVAKFAGQDDDYQKVLTVTGKESSTLERLRKPLSTGRMGVWGNIVSPGEVDQMRRLVERAGFSTLFSQALDSDVNIQPMILG